MALTFKQPQNTDSVLRRVKQEPGYGAQVQSAEQAKDLVTKHAYNVFDEENGAARRTAELDADHTREEYEYLKEEKNSLRKELKHTARTLTVSTARRLGFDKAAGGGADDLGDTPAGDIPFRQWKLYHKIAGPSFIFIAVVLLVLSGLNVVVTAENSGVAALIKTPELAYLLGFLPIAAAMALKSGAHLFDGDWPRKLYSWMIYLISLILMIAWIVLFAVNFEGLSAGIVWEQLGNPSSHNTSATALTVVQILAEIFIGAALFLFFHQIWASYSSDYVIDNPRFHVLERNFRSVMKDYQTARAAYVAADSQLTQLVAAREAFAERSLADWHALSDK